MKITQEVRDYAASLPKEAQQGMEEKSIEFLKKGSKIYS